MQVLQVAARLSRDLFEKWNSESSFSSLQSRHFLIIGIDFAYHAYLDTMVYPNLS
jgi:hypothetical protein